jgi:hypothetical protein
MITINKCGAPLYVSIPRKGLSVDDAIKKLVKAAVAAGGTPHKEILDAGILGEDDGPTLYVMKADLVTRCRQCDSTKNVNENGCCPKCQLKEAKAA